MTNAVSPPRVVVEMTSDDLWTVVYFLNGSEAKETCPPYMIAELVKDCISRVAASQHAAKLRLANQKSRERHLLHIRAWKNVAYGAHGGYKRGFGEAFANKTVGTVKVRSIGPKPTPALNLPNLAALLASVED